MSFELRQALITIAVGVGATITMDLWSLVLRRAFTIAPPNYCFVGRWLRHMPAGTFRHRSIAGASSKSGECATGWSAHYLIGIVFATLLVFVTSTRWLQEPRLLPALVFGLVTAAVPFFVMQPAFGLGVASSKIPNPAQARLRSLMNHAVFGAGLYLSALTINSVFRA